MVLVESGPHRHPVAFSRWLLLLATLALALALEKPLAHAAAEFIKHSRNPVIWLIVLFWEWYYVFIAVLPELFVPERRQTAWARFRGLPWRAIEHVLTVTSVVTFQEWVTSITPWKPWFHVDLGKAGTPWVLVLLGPFLALFVGDFFYYWFHRAQHRFAWLWRLHSIHHSIRDLNALNVYHHWTERFLWVLFVFGPISMVIRLDTPQVLFVSFFVWFYGESIHSNARLRYGIFRYLITEPRFHRIHHSLEERHHHHNFSAYFPIIDTLFGTAHFPEEGEYPAIGLRHQAEVKSLGDYVFARGDRIA